MDDQELLRYQRQIDISGLGLEGQARLKKATVVLAGAGGLGSPAALYLTAAGIGNLRVIDSDIVETTNLNRQILHWSNDIHRPKVESAREKLLQLNPFVNIDIFNIRLNEENFPAILTGSDAIVDAVDSLQTRYVLNKVSQLYQIPLIHGAVSGFEGRVMTVMPGQSACLMCLYRGIDISVKTPIIGATAGVVASLQVTETVKLITGIGKLLVNRFLIYDGLNMRFAEIQVIRDPQCPHCGGK